MSYPLAHRISPITIKLSSFLALLIAYLFFIEGSSAQPNNQNILTFRDIPLGISQSEFMKRPPPDAEDRGSTRPICYKSSAEKNYSAYDLSLSEDFISIGVDACAYMRKSPYSQALQTWSPKFAGNERWQTTFYFSPPQSDQQRKLFLVTIRLQNLHAVELTRIISSRYGEPSVEASKARNRLGQELPYNIRTWVVGTGRIVMSEMDDRADVMNIKYVDDKLMLSVDSAMSAGLKNKASKI